MTPAAIELAKRLGAELTRRGLWQAGMRWLDPTIPRGYPSEGRFDDYDPCEGSPGEYPDLDDWATVGCLVGLLEEERKKWGAWQWSIERTEPQSPCGAEAIFEEEWFPDNDDADRRRIMVNEETPGEAVAALLLSVWEEKP
jgi:hypothetical protein